MRGRAGSDECMGCRSRQVNRQTDERTTTQTDLVNSGDRAEPELQEVKVPCLLVTQHTWVAIQVRTLCFFLTLVYSVLTQVLVS